jgi:hypothetical protein
VPSALVKGLPVGVSFFGTAFSEPTLIKLASGFEHVTKARSIPRFIQELGQNSQGDAGDKNRGKPARPQRPLMI